MKLKCILNSKYVQELVKRTLLTTRDKVRKEYRNAFMNPDVGFDEVVKIQDKIANKFGIQKKQVFYHLEDYNFYKQNKHVSNLLSQDNFIKKFSGKEMTLGHVLELSDNQALKPFLGNTPEETILDIAYRHADKGGGKIKFLNNPDLYDPKDWVFEYKGKKYDYLEIAKSRNDPNFKEVWKAFDDLEKFESHIVDDPKLLKQFGFKKPTKLGTIMKEKAYGVGTDSKGYFRMRSNDIDHFGSIIDEPFTNLRVLPARINRSAGAASFYTKGTTKAAMHEKMGYNFAKDIDTLIKDELNLAKKVLIFDEKGKHVGKKLRTSYKVAQDFVTNRQAASAWTPDYADTKKVPKATKVTIPAGSSRVSSVAGVFDDALKTKTAKNIGRIVSKFGKKGARFLASDWVWPEVAIAWAEYKNRKQKGQSTERARSETLKMATLGLYDQQGTEKEILEQAKMLGYEEDDIRALDNFIKINKLDEEIQKKSRLIDAMELGAVEQGVYGKAEEMEKVQIGAEGGAQALRDEVAEMKKTKESLTGFYFGALGDKDASYGAEVFSKSLKSLSDTEFNASLEDRMKQADPYAGAIGNVLKHQVPYFTL